MFSFMLILAGTVLTAMGCLIKEKWGEDRGIMALGIFSIILWLWNFVYTVVKESRWRKSLKREENEK